MALSALWTVSTPARADAADLRVVEMVVAQVDSTVFTLSELIAETRMVMLRTHGPELARTLPLTRDLLRAVLRAMVSRELLLAEARRLQLREIPRAEVDAAANEIRRRFSTSGDYLRFLERVGFTVPQAALDGGAIGVPPVLAAILRAEKQVERFIALRIRPAAAVRDLDVQRCFEANRAAFGSAPLATVRATIEETIRNERAEEVLRELIEQLERRATIRYAPRFTPEADDDEEDDDDVALRCGDPRR